MRIDDIRGEGTLQQDNSHNEAPPVIASPGTLESPPMGQGDLLEGDPATTLSRKRENGPGATPMAAAFSPARMRVAATKLNPPGPALQSTPDVADARATPGGGYVNPLFRTGYKNLGS